ncbi:hypothetical protein [Anaerobacillus sp. 1_MG-2023]|uniref:hypothetical protein n=1 Tax=Bacillales TaxID=1385 RepID=UPI0026E1D169|nr:hypothetical protein [Anaerobacillus sp. 1_MG-2023]MDO6654680.1 hypothetical protein [Anaerobacillus sp. 1_MG-2023]
MTKKKVLSPFKEFLVMFSLFGILFGVGFLAFYYLGFNIGFPIALALLILIAYISRRFIKQSDENFLTPTDRKFNMKKHPWFVGVPLFILFFVGNYVRYDDSLITALIITLINFFFSFVVVLGVYYFKMKNYGYRLKDGHWSK